MDDRQAVTLGETTADLVVRNGRVLLPGTDRFARRDVLVADDRIAALPDDGSDAIDDSTLVVDATDRHVVPGFIDPHTHVDTRHAYERYYHHSLAAGTTTVITELQDFGAAFGAESVEVFLDATADLPLTTLAAVPPMPLVDTFEPAWADEDETHHLLDALDNDRVVGVGEIDWIHVVGRDSAIDELVDAAHDHGLRVAAHGAGCSGEKLAALATVVDNDHEAIDADGIVERVENGIHAVGRSGGIRDDVAAVAEAFDRVDPAELSLSSDGVRPRAMLEEGHMDAVLRRAIAAGIPPIDALRMATAVPARHYGLDQGVIAPGRPADLVVLDDLERVSVETVVAGGEVVVRDGEPLVGPRPYDYPAAWTDSVDVAVAPEAFRVADRAGPIRAIEYDRDLLSHETAVDPPAESGELLADPATDVAKATLFDRRPGSPQRQFTGFITGFGLESGAVATTHCWEVPGLLVVGVEEAAMERAAAHLVEAGGGWAVAEGDALLAVHETPVAGVAATGRLEETADALDAIRGAIRSLGCDVARPLLGLETLTFPGVPSLKLTPAGYADVLGQELVGLNYE